jgi:glutaredoxin
VNNLFFGLLVCIFLACGIAAAQKTHQSTRGKEKLKIELLYFNSCPTYKKALANIKAALKEKNLQAELRLIDVESEKKAQNVGFQGSPSVRINGKDLEGRDEGYSFSCRLYNVNGKPSTAPSKEAIIAKIESLMK